jgi:hypothetical protein
MTLTFPSGMILVDRPGITYNPYNIPWSDVARWEENGRNWFSNAAAESAVAAELIAAMAILESDANHTWPSGPNKGQVIEVWDNFPQDGPSVGIMQVKPQLWGDILPGADAYTAQGNIRLGARLMRNFIQNRGSWEEAIKQDYHPGTSPGGITPQMYVDTIVALMAAMTGAGPTSPVACPLSAPPAYDGTPKTINDVVFTPDKRTVHATNAGLNCRQYATTAACRVRPPLAEGEAVDVLYWVRGESVEGEDRWWVAEDGARIWSGGTDEKPMTG